MAEPIAAYPATASAGAAIGPISRLAARLSRLPAAGIWFAALVFTGLVAWAHAVLWLGGRLAVGTFDPSPAVLAFYGPFGLAVWAIGLRVARGALVTFWPATGWPIEDQPAWWRRFAVIPPPIEVAAFLVGAAGGLLALVASPDSVLGAPAGRLAVYVAFAPAFVLGYGMSGAGFMIALRWLLLVARIHREATAIDPFDRAPIYAFSRLTVTAGLAYLGVTYFTLTVNGAFQAGNLPSLAFVGASGAFGVLVFIAPLWGIHGRLVDAKDALRLDVERRVTRVSTELYERVDAGDFPGVAPLSGTLSSLNALRDRIERLPTWPWPPQLLRGFVSALLLPVVVYVRTRTAGILLGT